MSAAYHIECIVSDLTRAKNHAVEASLDHHFISEVEHLISTAKHNLDEAKEENSK